MAQNETWLKHDLLEAVKVQYLDGNLFSMDNAGNLIGVTLTRDGEDYSGGGSVSANVIRSDGGTVAVSGALSGKTATVVLPQAAYAVPGVVSIIVKLTASGQVTTIAALVANVYRSSTDTAVDPGTIIPSIQTLISQINTAVASIPADYSALWTKLAPAFSTDASYVAGQYVTYNSGLYRFNTSHSGSWSSSDVTAVNLGGEITELKSALFALPGYSYTENIAYGKLISTTYGSSNNLKLIENLTLTAGDYYVYVDFDVSVSVTTAYSQLYFTQQAVGTGWKQITQNGNYVFKGKLTISAGTGNVRLDFNTTDNNRSVTINRLFIVPYSATVGDDIEQYPNQDQYVINQAVPINNINDPYGYEVDDLISDYAENIVYGGNVSLPVKVTSSSNTNVCDKTLTNILTKTKYYCYLSAFGENIDEGKARVVRVCFFNGGTLLRGTDVFNITQTFENGVIECDLSGITLSNINKITIRVEAGNAQASSSVTVRNFALIEKSGMLFDFLHTEGNPKFIISPKYAYGDLKDYAERIGKPFYGKKILSLGDSYTWLNFYGKYLAKATGTTQRGRGQNGNLLKSFCNDTYTGPDGNPVSEIFDATLLADYDIVTIMGGANDYGHGSDTLGTIADDTTANTIYGSVKYLIDKILSIKPTMKIFFCTQPYRSPAYTSSDPAPGGYEPNENGLTMENIAGAIIDACRHWGIPCFDFYACSNWNSWSLPVADGALLTNPYTYDGLHPKDGDGNGADMLGTAFGEFINQHGF